MKAISAFWSRLMANKVTTGLGGGIHRIVARLGIPVAHIVAAEAAARPDYAGRVLHRWRGAFDTFPFRQAAW